MMYSLPISTWIRLVVWTLIGVFVYAFYGYHHSKVRLQKTAAQSVGPAAS
jgi:APA family basic amino acid/polyamine antiporter